MHTEIFPLLARSDTRVLIASASVSCGEPAEICTELERVDLNEYITNGENGVYLIRAVGDSMEAEIRRGDLMIVNRNLQARGGDVVVAYVNGNYTVKIYKPKRNALMLVPKNAKYKSQIITRRDDFEVFGVVTDVLHKLKKN